MGSGWKDTVFLHFRAVFLKGRALGTAEAFCPGTLRHINKSYHHIIVTNYSDPTGLIALTYMKLRRIPYMIEGDGAFPKGGKGLRERLKHWAISGAELCFSTGKMHDAYYRKYNAKKIVRYPFSSVKSADIPKRLPSLEEKMSIRNRLGIPEKKMVLAVGQLIPRKGYDLLIRAAERMDRETGIYIVGGNPPEAYLEEKKRAGLTHLHFVPFKTPDELKCYYLAADLFVHPCREDIWGLVVNEALSYGLPVISTEKCNAALELVTEGVNGCIVPAGDSNALVDAMIKCLDRSDMAEAALKSAETHTIETMAAEHMVVFSGRSDGYV